MNEPDGGASHFRPPHAVLCWVDDVNVYVELPGSPPYIQAYPLTDAGLSKALNVLKNRRREAPARYADHPFKLPEPGHVTRATKPSKPQAEYTAEQREAARAALKRVGLLRK